MPPADLRNFTFSDLRELSASVVTSMVLWLDGMGVPVRWSAREDEEEGEEIVLCSERVSDFLTMKTSSE